MQVGHATRVVDGGLVASVRERDAVAELMTPPERLLGRPPLYIPRSAGVLLALLLLSPSEPDDDE